MRALLTLLAALVLSACASLPGREPVQVTVAGIESLPGEGLELRMLVRLRVQNPNDVPIEYNGAYLRLDVQNRTFASGVSDERGVVPRFGEAIVSVPVTASVLRTAWTVFSMMDGRKLDRLSYTMEGKLNGPLFGSTRFQATGELALPGG
jgi:LEA14-like dessication related protein